MCVFSTASALFMFPALYLYYKPALDMYKFEKADGVGYAYDLVLQGFLRFASIALGPVFISVSVIYLLVSSFILLALSPGPSHTSKVPVDEAIFSSLSNCTM